MKKLLIILCALLMLLSFSSCSEVERSDAEQVANNLIKYIEQGDYDSASDMFCEDADVDGITLSELLNQFESATGLDLQSGIEIVEFTAYESKYSGSYGTVPCGFIDFQTTIDGEAVNIDVDMLKEDDEIKCYFFNLEYKDELYQYFCDTQ